jgi:hypothetical protein
MTNFIPFNPNDLMSQRMQILHLADEGFSIKETANALGIPVRRLSELREEVGDILGTSAYTYNRIQNSVVKAKEQGLIPNFPGQTL